MALHILYSADDGAINYFKQMQLILDFGNTYYKLAVFSGTTLMEVFRYTHIDLSVIKEAENKYPEIKSAILSSVIYYPDEIKQYLCRKYFFIELNAQTPIPVLNKYHSPETLGTDRIAAVVAAHRKFPESPVLVIEAGSCITYDFVTAKGEYLGGSISPGLEMRFKALHNFTGKLPLVKTKEINFLIGTTTEKAILAGVINGITQEIKGIIEEYKKNYDNLTVILSGGDQKYFDKRLKSNIFAISNIVLQGLNLILNFNVKK